MFNPIVIIPFYNHSADFERVAEKFKVLNLPILIVNDGSDQNETKKLTNITKKHHFLQLNLFQNNGKGAAVLAGIRYAQGKGYTHVLQIDADGQHNLQDVPSFIKSAKNHPDSVIVGDPVYPANAPKSRLYGRQITRFWVWIETGFTKMPDTMCGFRVYPIKQIAPLLSHIRFLRMGFDIEILVKCKLNKIPLISLPTKVQYLENGHSHFHAFRDNVQISLAHTYLCCYAIKKKLLKGTK